MPLLPIVLCSAILLGIAYVTYGRYLARLFQLDPNRKTPAVELADGQDYEPTEPRYLLGQHFSAIAAAGPIVGPILAGVMFGWVPALLWILVGSVLIGGVHDLGALMASVRHRARSIAEVVREHMSRRTYALFLSFIWIALVYIIVAFTDITARAFVGVQKLENGVSVAGGGIATASLLYLLIPMAMGLALRFGKLSLGVATVIFLPMVIAAIVLGPQMPLNLEAFGLSPENALRGWTILILVYCVAAAAAPVWIVLQPRGHLGGYFLYAAIIAGAAGVLFAGKTVSYPAFIGWQSAKGEALMPFLFITIACGACSGFHSLISSGTTAKQLRNEADAKPVAYGSMLLEAFVAILALTTVMTLAPGSDLAKQANPNLIYAQGIGGYLQTFGVPGALAATFALMAFTTFVYDTLDVCTRLGRYIFQELTGMTGAPGRWLGTSLTAIVPLFFLWGTGGGTPAWRTYWGLFGASNQLLAALALLGIGVWLWRTRRESWILPVVGLPCLWMGITSVSALATMVMKGANEGFKTPVPIVAAVLIGLALWMLLEAIDAFRRDPGLPTPAPSA